jgi:hypothetical protein
MNRKLYRPQFLAINASNCWFDAKLIDRREGRLMGVVHNHLDANRTDQAYRQAAVLCSQHNRTCD